MREIFKRNSFWFILFILLSAVCVYPPFRLVTEVGVTVERKWQCIFTALPVPDEVPEVDLRMLLVEATIAVLLAVGISLVLFGIKKLLRQMGLFYSRVGKPLLKD